MKVVIHYYCGVEHGTLLREPEVGRDVVALSAGEVTVAPEAPSLSKVAIVRPDVDVTYSVRKNRVTTIPDADSMVIRAGDDSYAVHIEAGWELALYVPEG